MILENQVPLSVTIAVAVASSLLALLGALGSQIISAFANLRMKRLELAYARKADAYKDFLLKTSTFVLDPWDEEKYVQYLCSYNVVLVVASDAVHEVLKGSNGVNMSAQRLRGSKNQEEMVTVKITTWSDSMEAVTRAMREDLQSLSKH